MPRKKMTVGPLPPQIDSYDAYEETELRWDRIVLVLLILLLVGFLVYYLLSGDTNHQTQVPLEKAPAESAHPAPAPMQESDEKDLKNETLVTQSDVNEPAMQEEAKSPDLSKPSAPEQEDVVAESSREEIPDPAVLPGDAEQAEASKLPSEQFEEKQGQSPVSILRPEISEAVLTRTLVADTPGASLGKKVRMAEEGIIKVILFTRMTDMKGQTLFHDWYLDDVHQARVRIPVNVDNQSSSSSKFINQQMLGDWYVRISDQRDEIYAEARFEVH